MVALALGCERCRLLGCERCRRTQRRRPRTVLHYVAQDAQPSRERRFGVVRDDDAAVVAKGSAALFGREEVPRLEGDAALPRRDEYGVRIHVGGQCEPHAHTPTGIGKRAPWGRHLIQRERDQTHSDGHQW